MDPVTVLWVTVALVVAYNVKKHVARFVVYVGSLIFDEFSVGRISFSSLADISLAMGGLVMHVEGIDLSFDVPRLTAIVHVSGVEVLLDVGPGNALGKRLLGMTNLTRTEVKILKFLLDFVPVLSQRLEVRLDQVAGHFFVGGEDAGDVLVRGVSVKKQGASKKPQFPDVYKHQTIRRWYAHTVEVDYVEMRVLDKFFVTSGKVLGFEVGVFMISDGRRLTNLSGMAPTKLFEELKNRASARVRNTILRVGTTGTAAQFLLRMLYDSKATMSFEGALYTILSQSGTIRLLADVPSVSVSSRGDDGGMLFVEGIPLGGTFLSALSTRAEITDSSVTCVTSDVVVNISKHSLGKIVSSPADRLSLPEMVSEWLRTGVFQALPTLNCTFDNVSCYLKLVGLGVVRVGVEKGKLSVSDGGVEFSAKDRIRSELLNFGNISRAILRDGSDPFWLSLSMNRDGVLGCSVGNVDADIPMEIIEYASRNVNAQDMDYLTVLGAFRSVYVKFHGRCRVCLVGDSEDSRLCTMISGGDNEIVWQAETLRLTFGSVSIRDGDTEIVQVRDFVARHKRGRTSLDVSDVFVGIPFRYRLAENLFELSVRVAHLYENVRLGTGFSLLDFVSREISEIFLNVSGRVEVCVWDDAAKSMAFVVEMLSGDPQHVPLDGLTPVEKFYFVVKGYLMRVGKLRLCHGRYLKSLNEFWSCGELGWETFSVLGDMKLDCVAIQTRVCVDHQNNIIIDNVEWTASRMEVLSFAHSVSEPFFRISDLSLFGSVRVSKRPSPSGARPDNLSAPGINVTKVGDIVVDLDLDVSMGRAFGYYGPELDRVVSRDLPRVFSRFLSVGDMSAVDVAGALASLGDSVLSGRVGVKLCEGIVQVSLGKCDEISSLDDEKVLIKTSGVGVGFRRGEITLGVDKVDVARFPLLPGEGFSMSLSAAQCVVGASKDSGEGLYDVSVLVDVRESFEAVVDHGSLEWIAYLLCVFENFDSLQSFMRDSIAEFDGFRYISDAIGRASVSLNAKNILCKFNDDKISVLSGGEQASGECPSSVDESGARGVELRTAHFSARLDVEKKAKSILAKVFSGGSESAEMCDRTGVFAGGGEVSLSSSADEPAVAPSDDRGSVSSESYSSSGETLSESSEASSSSDYTSSSDDESTRASSSSSSSDDESSGSSSGGEGTSGDDSDAERDTSKRLRVDPASGMDLHRLCARDSSEGEDDNACVPGQVKTSTGVGEMGELAGVSTNNGDVTKRAVAGTSIGETPKAEQAGAGSGDATEPRKPGENTKCEATEQMKESTSTSKQAMHEAGSGSVWFLCGGEMVVSDVVLSLNHDGAVTDRVLEVGKVRVDVRDMTEIDLVFSPDRHPAGPSPFGVSVTGVRAVVSPDVKDVSDRWVDAFRESFASVLPDSLGILWGDITDMILPRYVSGLLDEQMSDDNRIRVDGYSGRAALLMEMDGFFKQVHGTVDYTQVLLIDKERGSSVLCTIDGLEMDVVFYGRKIIRHLRGSNGSVFVSTGIYGSGSSARTRSVSDIIDGFWGSANTADAVSEWYFLGRRLVDGVDLDLFLNLFHVGDSRYVDLRNLFVGGCHVDIDREILSVLVGFLSAFSATAATQRVAPTDDLRNVPSELMRLSEASRSLRLEIGRLTTRLLDCTDPGTCKILSKQIESKRAEMLSLSHAYRTLSERARGDESVAGTFREITNMYVSPDLSIRVFEKGKEFLRVFVRGVFASVVRSSKRTKVKLRVDDASALNMRKRDKSHYHRAFFRAVPTKKISMRKENSLLDVRLVLGGVVGGVRIVEKFYVDFGQDVLVVRATWKLHRRLLRFIGLNQEILRSTGSGSSDSDSPYSDSPTSGGGLLDTVFTLYDFRISGMDLDVSYRRSGVSNVSLKLGGVSLTDYVDNAAGLTNYLKKRYTGMFAKKGLKLFGKSLLWKKRKLTASPAQVDRGTRLSRSKSKKNRSALDVVTSTEKSSNFVYRKYGRISPGVRRRTLGFRHSETLNFGIGNNSSEI